MIDDLFFFYDRWNGLIPFLGGIYATLMAFGYLPRKIKDPERHALWLRKFGPMMRVLGPLVIVIGIITLARGLTKGDVIDEMIAELNAAPKMIDPVTRFDRAVRGPGKRLTIDQTVTNLRGADVSKATWENFVPQWRQNILKSKIGQLPRRGVTVVYRCYGNDGKLIGDVTLSP